MEVHYYEPPIDAPLRLAEAFKKPLARLGFTNAPAAIMGLLGQDLTGEELIAFEEVQEGLTASQRQDLYKILRMIAATGITYFVKGWNMAEPLTPENVRRLPLVVQKRLVELGENAGE